MKLLIVLVFSVLFFNSCKKKSKNNAKDSNKSEKVEYTSFGKEIIADDAIKSVSMAYHYETMNIGDSINSKMIAKVNSVCQVKGCWMTLNIEGSTKVMVKFKDYGFFVPKDITGKDVIVNGKAYVKEVSVDEQKHYAKDEGKSTKAIANITKPKKTYLFEADGVLLKN
ncbi:DUF4920 domain-containing protein [Flavivirga aquatica]|uniref:DUF4920 domain-containing protein n=1 Tax=Flavivirga aquatica TaxID=1849968 RepID=A0A1E5SIE1_9FLAO|nr:DUF4920 domain-containing protein [Flavivirga aquatica]OEJ98881.1 DUF4920 domain-containing protein [Flavivirga aquatica]